MNTAALKTFAPAVRRQLMEAVTRKLDFALTAKTPDFLTTYAPQVTALRKLAEQDRKGLIERVAYTWFNRLAALRFMDAHGWHPFRARVLTPANESETQPELLKLTRAGNLPAELQSHTNPQRLNDLLDGRIPSPDAQGEVYRHLVLAACHFYHALLPDIFEKLDDETELLLPDDLLTEHSVVHGFRTEISDADCSEGDRANVEILGWLYQFYISEKKDQVMARKSAVPTEDIPAVTQLFTPHWIVRYLVENSLGRLWLLNRPQSKLRDHMPYYIEGEAENDYLKITKPEEIKLLDPAGGSGHMLTYAFDLLVLIYEEEGYAPTEIPALILKHNLYGLEICPRAAQLAELALVFKAREKSRRFFQPEHIVRPNILELQEVKFAEGELSAYFTALGAQPSTLHAQLTKLLDQFEEAKNFGSLIQPCLNETEIQHVRSEIVNRKSQIVNADLLVGATHLKVLRVLAQAEALTQRYHVVVANPPYMGAKGMNAALKTFAQDNYADSRSDLFAVFMERGLALILQEGFMGMINLPSWLFLSSFESVRVKLIADCTIQSMLHMGRGIFGIDWGSVAFVVRRAPQDGKEGHFFKLHKRTFQHIYHEDIGRLFLNAKADKCYKYDFDQYRDAGGTNEIPSRSNPNGLQIYYRCAPKEFRQKARPPSPRPSPPGEGESFAAVGAIGSASNLPSAASVSPSPPAAGGEGRGEVGRSLRAAQISSPQPSTLNSQLSGFQPDADGIIPVLDGEWFEDDIVARTREFLRATFGEATLRENLRFIEESLGKELRKYFLTDFYKDHLQTYKKRPIYWLVQSPNKGFQCLIYLHRYTKDTMNLVLNRYLRDYQAKLRNRLALVTGLQVTATTAKEKTEARKETEKLTKILHECDEWERQTVLPLAQARIELDLDDGVKVNYLKLGEALAPIAGLAAKEEE